MKWGISTNEVFNDGSILKTEYGPPYVLLLWHWAYREGKAIELVRSTHLGAIEIAVEYWSDQIQAGKLPSRIQDANGTTWERLWETLREETE